MDRLQPASGDDIEWRERSEYWQAFEPTRRGPRKKYRYREPLILCGHGVRIRMDHGTLLVRNGLTHFPQKSEEIRFFRGDANLPDRIIVLDGSGGISFDALKWMSEQKIEFLQLDWRGRVANIAGGAGYSANPKLVEAQRNILGTKKQLEIARWLISEKLKNSVLTLQNSIPKSEIRENAISNLKIRISKIKNPRNSITISKLLGIEGQCARVYFSCWQGLPLHWEGVRWKPIPPSWAEFSTRTMGWRKRSRAARHPVNAMLNYGYGVLEHKVLANVLAKGFDPSIGIVHGNSQNKIPLAYDLMEPLRPTVDLIVSGFIGQNAFSPSDFSINKWGGCRLCPQLARKLVEQLNAIQVENMVSSFSRVLS